MEEQKKELEKKKKDKIIKISSIIFIVLWVGICLFGIVGKNMIKTPPEEVPPKEEKNPKAGIDDRAIEVANIINDNSNLPVIYMSKDDENSEYLKSFSSSTIEEKYYIPNYMSKDYYAPDIEFYYYGYPNDESEYRLASIKLKNNNYNILGVTIGDDANESISKIKTYGFEVINDSQDSSKVKLKKDKFTITLQIDKANNNKVEEIEISASSEYLGNREY